MKILRSFTAAKKVESIGVSLEIGQTKLVSEKISGLISNGVKPDEIVVVLPQDYMLFPVLNAIPDCVERLNVTMGYPLKETPLFGLLEASSSSQLIGCWNVGFQSRSSISRGFIHSIMADRYL